jgi:hypothetical protein
LTEGFDTLDLKKGSSRRVGVVRALVGRALTSMGYRFLAPNGLAIIAHKGLLWGVERTLSECIATSQFDPKRTFRPPKIFRWTIPGGFQGLSSGDYTAAWMILEGGYEAAQVHHASG